MQHRSYSFRKNQNYQQQIDQYLIRKFDSNEKINKTKKLQLSRQILKIQNKFHIKTAFNDQSKVTICQQLQYRQLINQQRSFSSYSRQEGFNNRFIKKINYLHPYHKVKYWYKKDIQKKWRMIIYAVIAVIRYSLIYKEDLFQKLWARRPKRIQRTPQAKQSISGLKLQQMIVQKEERGMRRRTVSMQQIGKCMSSSRLVNEEKRLTRIVGQSKKRKKSDMNSFQVRYVNRNLYNLY